MPVKNRYQHYDLSKSKLQKAVANIAAFGGVDYSTQKFNVANFRAVDLMNYIYKDGFIRKRNGYEQISKVNKVEYFDAFSSSPYTFNRNGNNFNGIWKFKAEDGDWHVIAHIGNILFEIKNIDSNENITIEPLVCSASVSGTNDNGEAVTRPLIYKLEDYKSSAFVGANRLWILGGNHFMCLRFLDNNGVTSMSYYPVANHINALDSTEDTFVPVTTSNISYLDAAIPTKTVLIDYPNKLTYWRKNKLISGIGKSEESTSGFPELYEYYLDSPLLWKNKTNDVAKVKIKINCKKIVGSEDSPEQQVIENENAEWSATWYEGLEGIFSPEKGVIALSYTYTDNNQQLTKYIGFIYDIDDSSKVAKLVLYDDYVPDITDGTSNIEITYPYYTGDDSFKEIDECHFGVLFGSNNARNRLFLSGNRKHGNADWHSSEPNYTDYETPVMRFNGNFSYFADASIMYYGETDNDVIGYEVVANDKLLVLKNKSDKEKTVYFRTPTLVKAIDASGTAEVGIEGETLYQEEFSLVKGNNSVAGISPKTIANFNGDTLFLDSNNQLVGLDISGIIGDNQRYANTRSKYIDRMLAKLDLSNALVWTDNAYLFIAIDDFGILATHFKTYDSEAKQYEWFYLTCENPSVFLEKDGVYYFANANGELYKFTKGVFNDIKKIFSQFTLSYNGGSLIVSHDVIEQLESFKHYNQLNQEVYGDFTFKMNVPTNATYLQKLYFKITSMTISLNERHIYINRESNYIELLDSTISLTENSIYYLNNTVFDSISNYHNFYGVKIKFEQIDIDGFDHADRFIIKELDGDDWIDVDITHLISAEICQCLEDEEAVLREWHESTGSGDYNTITLEIDGEELELVAYGPQSSQNSNQTFSSVIRNYEPVEALYMVAPMTFGSLSYMKTIYSYTIKNDVDEPSEVEVAYASNKIPLVDIKKMSYISLTKEQLGYDMNNLNYNSIDFDKVVVPRTYTFQRVLASQKFVCFVFRNYKNTDSILCGMSVTYSTPYPSYSGD